MWPACGEHALVLLSREEDDRGGLAGLGRYSGGLAPLVAAQVRPGKFSLLPDFYFSFLIFLLFVLT